MVTKNIGLMATASTTYNEPSRRPEIRLVDHIAAAPGWNVVTSVTDMEARNFNRDAAPPPTLRPGRVRRGGSRTV
jgi:alkanesulfonate monooxygenase